MVSRKIEGWKAICKRHSEDLIAYWSNRYEAQVALREEQQVQQKEVEKNRALRKASMLNNPNKKGIDAKKGKDAEKMEEEEEEEENDDDGEEKDKEVADTKTLCRDEREGYENSSRQKQKHEKFSPRPTRSQAVSP